MNLTIQLSQIYTYKNHFALKNGKDTYKLKLRNKPMKGYAVKKS